MNEKISTFLDGELDHEQVTQVIRQLGSDASRREIWDSYHLIGEVLRGESSCAAHDVMRLRKSADVIFSRLSEGPTVLSPAAIKIAPIPKITRLALAMAASVVTVSAIVVIAFKQQGGVVAPVQMVQQIAPKPTAQSGIQADARVNDYLAIHRQFANPNAFQSASARREAPRAAAGQ
ncbi:MAG: sigma-E factor negative regulatory protein [Pseudomonadota bacterium]